MTNWKTFPKAELHLHLEGAAPPSFIRRLAKEKNKSLDGVFDEHGAYQYKDFSGFLATYEVATSVLTTPEDYHRLTAEVLKRLSDQAVVYTEIFNAPDFCGGGDPVAWDEYLGAMEEAVADAEKQTGIIARFIPTCVRHFGPEKAHKAAETVVRRTSPIVVGWGMGGNETWGRASDFGMAFATAAEAGLKLTSHAGEFGGPQSVIETLDNLKVQRIGHGVRAIEDPALIRRLVDEDIVLEVNPGSNIALKVYENWHDHPVEKLRRAGVSVTISTDDPPFFHTTLEWEYQNLEKSFGWNEDIARQANMIAADAAFCDNVTKEKIKNNLTG